MRILIGAIGATIVIFWGTRRNVDIGAGLRSFFSTRSTLTACSGLFTCVKTRVKACYKLTHEEWLRQRTRRENGRVLLDLEDSPKDCAVQCGAASADDTGGS